MSPPKKVSLQRIIGQSRVTVDRDREQQAVPPVSSSASSYEEDSEVADESSAGEEVYADESTTETGSDWSSTDYGTEYGAGAGYAATETSPRTPSYQQSNMSTTKNVLSSDVEIKGSLKFSNDLVIDGHIEGEVTSDNGSLTVGENAYIKGEIKTQRVTVFGKVEGNVTVSERCEIKTNSEVLGDIQAATLTMEEGAIFSGQSRVGRAAASSGSVKTTAPSSSSSSSSTTAAASA